MKNISIIVHGGAWAIPDEFVADNKTACADAVATGWGILESSGSAIDAVEAAVRILEDAPSTGAGRGANLNRDGNVELDGAIMDGSSLNAGGVAALQRIANPISVARKVMEETPHVLLCGEGALQFARSQNFEECDSNELITEAEYQEWQKGDIPTETLFVADKSMDTVGCVAYDVHGNIAVGNSTGGVRNKLPGRIGDSPIVGCGIYADNEIGGVACTGWGESIMRTALAKTTIELLKKYPPHEASQRAIDILDSRVKGLGGLIAISNCGEITYNFNTPRMAFGYRNSGMDEAFIGINPEDKLDYQYKYRQGVGIVMMNDQGKILICHRQNEPGHWQFPQGGIDEGENPIDTLFRELREEIGTDNILPILRLPHKTRYVWPKEKRENRYNDGQQHTWFLVKFLGQDSDLKPSNEFSEFRWITFDEILTETREIRRGVYTEVFKMLSQIKNEIKF